MTVSLEAISFNHDPVSATTDALTIRKNETEEISVPEWTRGMTRPEDSLAAYTIGQISANRLTIKAQFARQAGDPVTVEIYAVGRPGNVLGDVRRRTITFENGLSAFELFDLDSPSQNPGVRAVDIGWDWYIGGTLRQTTEHRIYTLLDEPTEPWGQPGSSLAEFQLPWTEVLEHACRRADGATSANDAAAMLTRWIFSLGETKLRYDDYSSGSSTFTIGGMRTFRCTRFLQALAEGPGTTARVNCTDCATILSSFANILGCDLTQSRIGHEFETNRIQKIGFNSPIRQDFSFHEVAWKFPREGAASLYDCCLRYDGDALPTDDNFSPELGINVPLGSRGSGYYFRLISPTSSGEVYEASGTRLRRKIDGRTTTAISLDPEQRRRLEKKYDFRKWQGTPHEPKQVCSSRYENQVVGSEVASTLDQHLFFKNFGLTHGSQSLAGFTPNKVDAFEAKPDPLRVTEVVWSSKGCTDAALRVLTYECSSIAAARSFLLTLLGEFHLPRIKRRPDFVVSGKPVKIGDVAFAGPDDLVLLFARANNVIFIQNAGRAFVPVSQFALAMDAEMKSLPDPKIGHLADMKHFNILDKQIRVGDEVHIHTNGIQLAKETQTQFKFFAPGGEVFLKGNDLLYRCQAAGEQSVIVLVQKPGGETARQVLKLFAELPAASQEYNCHKFDEPTIKEECVMPDIMGVWSSIRPTNNGNDTSADMTADGLFDISRPDPVTGEITGHYWSPGRRSAPQEVTGRVTFISPDSYEITLSHPVRERVTRHYRGRLVAMDNNNDFGVQIVAGRYETEIDETEVSGATATATFAFVTDGGQENGTWVATKP
jgi:hypothetical protein